MLYYFKIAPLAFSNINVPLSDVALLYVALFIVALINVALFLISLLMLDY